MMLVTCCQYFGIGTDIALEKSLDRLAWEILVDALDTFRSSYPNCEYNTVPYLTVKSVNVPFNFMTHMDKNCSITKKLSSWHMFSASVCRGPLASSYGPWSGSRGLFQAHLDWNSSGFIRLNRSRTRCASHSSSRAGVEA